MNYLQSSITVFCIFLILSCNKDEKDDRYNYKAYDVDGTQVVQGTFRFEFIDSVRIEGEWHFEKIGNPVNIGPQTGDGVLLGTLQNNEFHDNLNPEWIDNNVFLDGQVKNDEISGTWIFSGIAVGLGSGEFTAKK